MSKVFLVYPPSGVMNREGRCQQPTKNLVVIPSLPPLELMYLASVARQIDCECKIKDYNINGETLDDFALDLKEFNPEYLLLNVATPTLESDLALCNVAKKILPKVKIIATGAYFLTYCKEVLESNSSLDFIIRGEAEYTFKELLSKKPLNEILGLVYRDGSAIISNELRPFIENLDSIPFPARDLVDNNLFKRPDNGEVQTLIKVSRGCPYHCFFCLATPLSGAKVRCRSVKNIVGEIRECVEKYNINNFVFWSDIFDLDKKWVLELCEEIINSELKITWSANTRADLADEEIVKAMKDAGCKLVSIGVESGSQEILDKMGKNITLNQVRETVKLFKKHKISIYNYFVMGLPWEREDDLNKTIEFALELDSDFASFYTAAALPGSRFYDYVKENKLDDLTDMGIYADSYYYPNVPTHFLSKEVIFKFHKKAMRKYYLRPSYILKRFVRICSWYSLKSHFRAGINLLFKK